MARDATEAGLNPATPAQRGLLLGGTLLAAMLIVLRPMSGPKFYTLENGCAGLLLILLALTVAGLVFLKKRAELPDSLTLLALLWTGLLGWGVCRAPNLGAALPVLGDLLSHGLLLLCGFLLARHEKSLFGILCRVLIASICVEAYYGLWQSYFEFPHMIAKFNTDTQGAFESLRSSAGQARLKSGNIFGSFVNPNLLAAYILLGLGLTGGLLADATRSGHGLKRWARTLCGMFLLAMLLLALWLTDSKGGYVALLAGLWFFAVQRLREKNPRLAKLLTGVTAAGLGLLLVLLLLATFRLLGPQPFGLSMEVRFDYWRAALAMFADHPLQGVGLAGYAEHYSFYKQPLGGEVQEAHNDYLQLLAEMGVAALLAYAAIWIVTLRRASLPSGEAVNTDERLPSRTLQWAALTGGCGAFLFMFAAFLPFNAGDALRVLDGQRDFDTLLAALHTLSIPLVFAGVFFGLAPLSFSGEKASDGAAGGMDRDLLHGARAGLGAVLLHQLVDFDLRAQPVAGAMFFLAGMLFALRAPAAEAAGSALKSVSRFALPALALGLIPLLVWMPFAAGAARQAAADLETDASAPGLDGNKLAQLRHQITDLRRDSVAATPFDSEAWLDLGVALEMQRRADPGSVQSRQILNAFLEAETRRPLYAGPKVLLGSYFLREGAAPSSDFSGASAQSAFKQSADYFAAAARRYPLHPGLKIWQGDALLLAGDTSAAAEAYFQALQIDLRISDSNVCFSSLFTDPRPALFLRHGREKLIGDALDAAMSAVGERQSVGGSLVKGLRFRLLHEAAWRVHQVRSPAEFERLRQAADELLQAMETPAERAHAAFLRALTFLLAPPDRLSKNSAAEAAKSAWQLAQELQQTSAASGQPGTPPALFNRLRSLVRLKKNL
jgi:O-antigen ligase